jgi:hypothetical protein
MQLSTYLLPYSTKEVKEYIETRGESRPMSVGKTDDEAYTAEKGIRLNETLKGWPVGTCFRCSSTIHNAPFLSKSEPGEFCSRTCRDLQNETETKARRIRHFRECQGCGRKFLGKRANNTTCSANCRQKAHRRVALSPMSQIPQNAPCSLAAH